MFKRLKQLLSGKLTKRLIAKKQAKDIDKGKGIRPDPTNKKRALKKKVMKELDVSGKKFQKIRKKLKRESAIESKQQQREHSPL